MRKAVLLLRKDPLKIYELAYLVGYNDAHYFSNLFKKITGKTPRQFKVSASADKLLDNEYIRGFPVPQIGGK